VEGLSAILCKSIPPKAETSVNQFHVRALSQRIVDDSLVLIDSDGTCGINQKSSRFGVRRDTVDGAEDKLLLEVREEVEITFRLYKYVSK
jgi:hypothetical protein